MAIDPLVATQAAETLIETVKEIGKTQREKDKSKAETEQRKTEQEEKTKRNKDEAEAGVKHKTIEKKAETEQKRYEGERRTIKDSMDIVSKTSKDAMDIASKAPKKTIDILNDLMKESKDEHREQQKEANRKLEAKENEIKEYQKSLISAYVEVQKYQIAEEAKRIVLDNIVSFADKKAKLDEAIKNISYDIGGKRKELQPLEMELNTIKTEIKSLKDSYDDLGRRFEIVIKTMSELKYEYKHDLDPEKYNEKYQRKEREIKELINDITNQERQLLEKEKERLIKVEIIEPISTELKKIKKLKVLLENNREKILTTELHKIGNFQLGNTNTEKLNREDIIDAEEVTESTKFLK